MTSRIIIALFISLCLHSIRIKAQDLPFSQFFANKPLLNPAYTGNSERDFRLTSNYRDQWRSVSESFKSLAFTYDMPLYRDYFHQDYLGLGVTFFNEKAGVTELRQNKYQLHLAYHTKTDRYTTVSFGITGAFGRRNIDFSRVRWESQYNGIKYDPSLESGETQLSEQFNYWDFAAGGSWSYNDPNSEIKYNAGLSVYHLTSPKQTFAGDEESRLARRYQIDGSAEIGLYNYDLIPKLVLSRQRNYMGFIIGSLIRIKPDEQAESKYTDFNLVSSLGFGAFYRYRDAIILQANYDYKHTLQVGLSYDITLSSLRRYNNYLGGFEVTLSYTGIFNDNRIKVKNKGTDEKDKVNTRKM